MSAIGQSLFILLIYFIAGWAISVAVKKYSWLDFFWASSVLFFLVGLLSIETRLYQLGYLPFFVLVSMYLFWSVRLSLFLLFRIYKSEEDSRYVSLKEKWRTFIPLKFLGLYMSEALLAFILLIPIFIRFFYPASLQLIEFIAVVLFIIALSLESVADRQRKHFKENPDNEGKVCNTGLWRYSRHPNYFFELMAWFSFFIFNLSLPYWFLGIIPFAAMTLLICFVTGIPQAEASSLRSKGEAYREYQKTTHCLIPWIPKEVA